MNNSYLDHAVVMLEQVVQQVQNEFQSMDRNQLNWKPDEKSWSIAECLDHLIVTNGLYFKVFEDIKQNRVKNSFWAKIPGWPKFCGSMILKSVHPETAKKVKTFKVFFPTASDFPRTIIESFLNNQHQLIALLHELDGYENHDKIIISSPVSKRITLNLESAVNILWNHAVRHLNQARRLTEMEGFPANA